WPWTVPATSRSSSARRWSSLTWRKRRRPDETIDRGGHAHGGGLLDQVAEFLAQALEHPALGHAHGPGAHPQLRTDVPPCPPPAARPRSARAPATPAPGPRFGSG